MVLKFSEEEQAEIDQLRRDSEELRRHKDTNRALQRARIRIAQDHPEEYEKCVTEEYEKLGLKRRLPTMIGKKGKGSA